MSAILVKSHKNGKNDWKGTVKFGDIGEKYII